MPEKRIVAISAHRNGIAGCPFHVVNFKDGKEDMLAIVFASGACATAVFNFGLLKGGDFKFGSNSYRGDHYDTWLRDEIRKHEEGV